MPVSLSRRIIFFYGNEEIFCLRVASGPSLSHIYLIFLHYSHSNYAFKRQSCFLSYLKTSHLYYSLQMLAGPILRKFSNTTLYYNKTWPQPTWAFLGSRPQTIQNVMWCLVLFDATLRHMLYCSWNLHRIYTNYVTKSLLRNKMHMKVRIFDHFLSF